MRAWIVVSLVGLVGCNQPRWHGDRVDPACTWAIDAEVVGREGATTLESFELDGARVLAEEVLPDDGGYLEFRRVIRAARADVRVPVADPPAPRTDEEREVWRREDANAAKVYAGEVGRLRGIQCLEALLFARQHARYSELTRPTEMIATVLRKAGRLKVFFVGGDQMFPPKQLYGFDQAERAVADGWEAWFVIHNHTVQEHAGRPALGRPVPSTADVSLSHALVERLGLREVRVTNGIYTVEVRTDDLHRLVGRD